MYAVVSIRRTMDAAVLLMLVLATAVNCSLIQPPASAAAVAWQPASSDAPPADDGRY